MRGAALAVVVAVLVASYAPCATRAQTAGGDIVTTPSGGRLRGTVSEYEPGQRVVITLPDGSTHTLGPGEFSTVTFADSAPTSTATVVPPTPQALPLVTSVAPPSVPEPVRWSSPRAYAGANDGPWLNAELLTQRRRPLGEFHIGLQVDGGVVLVNAAGHFDAAAGFAGCVYADLTVSRDVTLRAALGGDFVAEGLIHIAYPGTGNSDDLWYGGAGALARILVGVDLTTFLTLRAGAEGGVVFPRGDMGGTVVGRVELALRLLDSRSLELGIAVAAGMRFGEQWGRYYNGGISMYVDRPPYVTVDLVLPAATAFVGWVFE